MTTNESEPNNKPDQKELGWNYRVTEDYVFFMEGFLHQWYKSPMSINNVAYNCCEQYMMARKAELFDDAASLLRIRQSENPLDQKTIGRSIRNFNEAKWKQHRFDIVYQGNLHKFRQNKRLRDALLSYPHSIQFVNANPGDAVWGIGVGVFDPKVVHKANWRGDNLLGEVITKVRDALLDEEAQSFIHGLKGKQALLTAGYVRLYFEKVYAQTVPSEIVNLLSAFFGALLQDVRFTLFNERNCATEKDGLLCKTSETPDREKCHRLFTTDIGYSKGVVVWKLKFSSSSGGHEGGVGIISGIKNKDTVLTQRPWINDTCFTDCVYWSRIGRNIKSANGNVSIGDTWQNGDVICILLNCEEWYVQFYLNDRLLQDKSKKHEYLKVKLAPNKTYFPIVAFYERCDEYEVLLVD